MKTFELREDFFRGVVSFRRGDGWLQPLRVREEEIPLHYDSFVEHAKSAAGCRLRFLTDSRKASLRLLPSEKSMPRRFDLTADAELLASVELPPEGDEVVFGDLPPGLKTLELWLPVGHEARVCGLALDEGARLETRPDTRPKWVTYGSSITHCVAAHGPSRTWPALVSRLRGLDLTALGYGGNCHMEPLVAMMIRDLPADFISLKVGINMSGTVPLRTFRTSLVGMVRIIREKHPRTPLAVISPIISPPRESTPSPCGMSLGQMRAELETAVERLAACGDDNVYYFSGLDLFGEDLVADYLPDMVHPNGDGYEIMGRNFAEKVFDKLFPGGL